MRTEEKTNKKKSSYELISKILIAILIVAILIQIVVMITIKIKTDNLKDKNNNLPTTHSAILIDDSNRSDI